MNRASKESSKKASVKYELVDQSSSHSLASYWPGTWFKIGFCSLLVALFASLNRRRESKRITGGVSQCEIVS